jgi:N4-gp56 family major capsid protein
MSAATAVTNANLSNTQATFYDAQAIEALYADLAFLTLTTPKTLPTRKGKTIQFFTYALAPVIAGVSAGSTPPQVTEGTVGSGIVPTAPSVQAVLGQYADFITCSDMNLEVAIDDELVNLSKHLGYKGALVIDTVTQMEIDAAVALDGSANIIVPDGSYMAASYVRSGVASLAGRNIRRFEDGLYHGLTHPFVLGDILNDVTVNGLTDILKRSESGQKLLQEGMGLGDERNVVDFAGVRWVCSTNVPLTAGVPTVGKNAYSSYITGRDGIFSVKLGNTDIPDDRNFKAKVLKFTESSFDPAGVIGGGVSYNAKYVCSPRPGTGTGTQGVKRFQSESSIA